MTSTLYPSFVVFTIACIPESSSLFPSVAEILPLRQTSTFVISSGTRSEAFFVQQEIHHIAVVRDFILYVDKEIQRFFRISHVRLRRRFAGHRTIVGHGAVYFQRLRAIVQSVLLAVYYGRRLREGNALQSLLVFLVRRAVNLYRFLQIHPAVRKHLSGDWRID